MDNSTPMKQSSESSSHNDVIVKIDNQEKDKEDPTIARGFSFSNMNSDSPVRGVVDRVLDSKQSFENDDFAANKYGKDASSDDDDYDDDEDEYRLMNQQRQRRVPSNLSYVPENDAGGEVLKCTSYQRRASLVRTKTQQSRLIDPPEVPYSSPYYRTGGHTPPNGGMARSGRMDNDDEDESLFDDDNPDDLKNNKLDAMTIIQWISFVLIIASLICTIRFPNWTRRSFRGLFLWQWELLILVLICGRLVSGWFVRIAVFFIERNFLLRKRLLYFVYGVRTPVQNCIWLCWVLIAWNSIFDETVEALHIPLLEVLNKFMVCMLIATSLWLIKTLIVKVLASTFHVNKFFDRIQDALFNQYVIETLSGPPLVEIHNHHLGDKSLSRVSEIGGYSFKGKGSSAGMASGRLHRNLGGSKKHDGKDQGITIDHLHRLNHENVSAWNMKRLMKIIRHGSLTTLDEHLQGTYYDEPGTEIRSEIEAKRAARNIFMNVTRRRSKYIYLDDLMRFLREDEAVKTLSLIVASPEDERIGKNALKNWVVSVFRERKALALTLNDTKTAVNKLHRMVNVLVSLVILAICLVILNIATTKVLVLISSQLVLVAFIFGNTCKTIFESIIFLFVIHPFDVGDRCEIDGVQLIVEEMNIMNTIFLRGDNQKVYFPNNTLATRSIGNYYRSPDMVDTIDFLIHVGTPADKLSLIKQRILSYIESNKDHWYPDPIVLPMDMYDLNTQKLSVWVQHKMNHQDITERFLRRGKIVEEMNRIFKELDIEYRTYPLDINIRSMPMPVGPERIPSTWGAPN
ncbi:putative mechanosensitive ion channel MscS, LSM domain superfamily [Helianthus annuus]|uniref:Mechanosensitive ion channel protein n=1 Tax=Helianthus annuus TaxID=4232 RepID=A0A251TL06_HELAN|nr:mechanosensitive ion channel protein 6 [Helianthus annuus]KAF5786222.1 putative mechanosensitive ion channel MscS, LSM domain superfamily [Helianthus annuus]KAJ0513674.1 putative mechanosensitive ion channel MscS, LSM domain superfamily [Helianthus annuus]KAJ0521557.1 putative mechanosensitive ion channel MscS, LSM domain superfamily [Helianthus annuus]KAJ0529778.1 putative mechanosensitive ion channel MscS, LSM domain superfamily [Helianthus annuus]KAJ0696650.1 putative mechanosensitive io